MISVLVKHSKTQDILRLTVSGHAEYDVRGKDLVCAAVSSITIGGCNALVELAEGTTSEIIEEGFVDISVTSLHPTQQMILKTLLYQLQTIEHSYKKYIKIKKQEV